MANIYFFDPLAALQAAQQSTIQESHLQTSQKQICFYNAEAIESMPSNCVSVPINNFYNYFFTTSFSIPQQINFDNQNFNDATKDEITQNIINTLTQVKKDRVQIVQKVLQAPLEAKSVYNYLFILLDYLEFIDTTPNDIEIELLIKLLEMTNFSIDNQLVMDAYQEERLHNFSANFYTKYHSTITSNIQTLHLHYILESLKTKQLNTEAYFKNLIAFLNDIATCIHEYKLVSYVFTEVHLSQYLHLMAELLFDESFMAKKLIEQKLSIYKFYYLTNLYFGRGDAYRKMFYTLKPYFLQALDKGLDELAFFLYTPLQMSYNGTAQTQEEMQYFNNEIERPLEAFIASTMLKKYNLKPVTRTISLNQPSIKVAFLQERIINYSIHKVFVSLLKSLKKYPNTQFEFTIYNLNFMEFGGSNPQIVEDLKGIGFSYVDLHQEYIKEEAIFYPIVKKALHVRERIIEDKIDILVGMHSRAEYNFLFTSRVAPKQLYWSHGNYAYALDAIDTYIKHGDRRGLVEEHCNQRFLQFGDPVESNDLNPPVDADAIKTLRAQFPKEAIILGTIGRLSKLDNEAYLNLIIEAMQENPRLIYLACGSGDASPIKKRVQEAGLLNRWYFSGHVNTHLYGHIIDIWPNTFPHSQGLSTLEYMAKGNIVIQMVTLHFSSIDMIETPFEKSFQALGYDMQKWLANTENRASVEAYLQSNFFTKESIQKYNFMLAPLLYVPTTSEASYRAKLLYLCENYVSLKEEIKRFSNEFTHNRWLNSKATATRFYEILQSAVGEK